MKNSIKHILPIPAPTEESEKRKNELLKQKKVRPLSQQESNELFALEMRQFWCCEC